MLTVAELSVVSQPKHSPWFWVRLDIRWNFVLPDKVSSGACDHLSQKQFWGDCIPLFHIRGKNIIQMLKFNMCHYFLLEFLCLLPTALYFNKVTRGLQPCLETQ